MNAGLGVFELPRVSRLGAARWCASIALGAILFTTVAVGAVRGLSAPPARAAAVTSSVPPGADRGIAAAAPAAPATSIPQPNAVRFHGPIGDNLTSALLAAGVPERQGREYIAVLARAIPLADGLSIDDRFDLVIERDADGALARLLYVGLDRVGRSDVELLRWNDGRQIAWINADGIGGGREAMAMGRPVEGPVTSGYGMRVHPILRSARLHKGMDVAAAAGSPIVAAADGRVVAAGWHGGYGRQVAIIHDGGLETTYSHMSRTAANPGEMVRRGQVIGFVGSSGLSTGPHVHFEVYRNGRAVNPQSVKILGGPAQLQGEKLQAFQSGLRQLLLLPGRG